MFANALQAFQTMHNMPAIKVVLDDPDAEYPLQAEPEAVGRDLTAIKVAKVISPMTTLYDTGLIVQPPEGYYTEIIARSSLVKTGYILTNSVGIIDPSYRGHLMIALTKIDPSMPDLEVPFTKCQLILRKAEYYNALYVEKDDLTETTRGNGGFGSTDQPVKLTSLTVCSPYDIVERALNNSV